MESFDEANSDPVGEAAANELDRLAELEDAAWYSQNLRCAPTVVKLAVVIGSIGVLTLLGVVFRDYGDTWQGIVLSLFVTVGFVASIIRLERRYSPARTPTTFPPRRVLNKQWKLILLIQAPTYFFIPVLINGVESGASWQFFGVIMAAILIASVLWSLALDKFGIIARFAPQMAGTP